MLYRCFYYKCVGNPKSIYSTAKKPCPVCGQMMKTEMEMDEQFEAEKKAFRVEGGEFVIPHSEGFKGLYNLKSVREEIRDEIKKEASNGEHQ